MTPRGASLTVRAVALIIDLLRHGVAAPADDDSLRELTPEGARAIERLATTLASASERPDRVFASPLLRAKQTAEIVARVLRLELDVEELIELEPERDPSGTLQALVALGVLSGHVLLVGHQPQIGRLVVELTGVRDLRVAPGALFRIASPEWPGRPAGKLVLTAEAGR